MRCLGLLLCCGVFACTGADTIVVEAEPGGPLPGLGAPETERFVAGEALFNRAYTPEEGLGPLFNQTRCSSCHDLPTSGGHGAEPVTKVSHFDDATGCSLLAAAGGDLLQASAVPALRALGITAEQIPAGASAVTEIRPPPLYGLGLVASVDEAEIRGRAEPTDRNGDGITGRVGHGGDGGLGRFGVKGQHATLESFIVDALNGELGLTTAAHPAEQRPNGLALPDGVDGTPDPEISQGEIDLLTAYVRFLAPPPRQVPEDPGERRSVARGERLFEEIGCATCHVPTMVTAESDIPALDQQRFRIYSDLLLHDMGSDLADICAPGAAPSEWMTTRLVGLRYRTEYLHNRRAQSLESAVQLHGGEGAPSRDVYRSLDPGAREDLMRFLRSL